MTEVIVKDADLQKATMEGMDEFLSVFTCSHGTSCTRS